MIQINLLPKEEQPPEPRLTFRLPNARFWISLVIGLGVLVPLGGVVLMQSARLRALRADIRAAEVEIRRLKPQVDRIRQLSLERDELNLRLGVVQDLGRLRYGPVEVVDHLADQVPEYLWLTKVSQSTPEDLAVEGMSFSNLMIAELMTRMEQSDLFENVTLVVAEKAKGVSDAGQPVLSFMLNARITP